MEYLKLNRAYTGLVVRKEGEMIAPTINLNQLYEAYNTQPGVTMESKETRYGTLKETIEIPTVTKSCSGDPNIRRRRIFIYE